MTKRKYEEPFKLNDMDFNQALARYAQTDPAEIEESAGVSKIQRQIEALLGAFEEAKHEDENGVELWFGRDAMKLLEYKSWDKFRAVIEKAWVSCRESGIDPAGHFARMDGMPWNPADEKEVFSQPGKNPKGGRPSENVILSRRALYLIAENGDPSKLPIAIAQRYFAEQTRRQEVADQSVEALTEDQRRVLVRERVTEQQKGLASAAHDSGVRTQKDFAFFQTEGYKGMYGGLNVDGIKRAKSIPARDQILDRMGSAELAANLFRLTQTEERLRRGDIHTKERANRTHHEIGKIVRKSMIEASGVPPEKLPAADHIKHARKRVEAVEEAQALPEPSKTRKGE